MRSQVFWTPVHSYQFSKLRNNRLEIYTTQPVSPLAGEEAKEPET